jgi:hypothetical protein
MAALQKSVPYSPRIADRGRIYGIPCRTGSSLQGRSQIFGVGTSASTVRAGVHQSFAPKSQWPGFWSDHRHANLQARSPAMARSARSERHRPRPRQPARCAVPLRIWATSSSRPLMSFTTCAGWVGAVRAVATWGAGGLGSLKTYVRMEDQPALGVEFVQVGCGVPGWPYLGDHRSTADESKQQLLARPCRLGRYRKSAAYLGYTVGAAAVGITAVRDPKPPSNTYF